MFFLPTYNKLKYQNKKKISKEPGQQGGSIQMMMMKHHPTRTLGQTGNGPVSMLLRLYIYNLSIEAAISSSLITCAW